MYADSPYASVPYAALGAISLFVAACVHTDSQLLYQCDVGQGVELVYQCKVGFSLVYNVTTSTAVLQCKVTSGVC